MKKLILFVAFLCAFGQTVRAQQVVVAGTNAVTGTIDANSDTVTMSIPSDRGYATVGVEATGTWAGTIAVKCAVRNRNAAADFSYIAIRLTPYDSTSAVTSFTANGSWSGGVAGCARVIVSRSAWTSGTATVTLNAVSLGGAGGGGGGGAAGDVNINQLAGGAAVGQAAMAASFPVVIASNQSAVTVSDGAGALNTIVDSGTLTAVTTVTTVTNPVTVTDGAGSLNVILDSGTLTSIGTSVTPGTSAAHLGKAEDAVAGSGDTGVLVLFPRQDSQSDLCADGDYCPATIDADGNLRVAFAGAAGGTSVADDADFTAGTTAFTPVGGFYQSAVTACTDGDTCAAGLTAGRAVKVAVSNADGSLATVATDGTFDSAVPATGPAVGFRVDTTTPTAMADGDLVYPFATTTGALYTADYGLEDVAETAAQPLSMQGSVRRDTAASSAGTTGDNATVNTDSVGRLWTAGAVVEDAAETAADSLISAGTVRRDTAASSAGTTGDNATLNTDSIGRLWVSGAVVEDAAETAGAQVLAVGSVRRDVAASSAGTDGDNATVNTDSLGQVWTRFLDPCSGVAKTVIPINISTATTTELTAALAGASNNYYVCSLTLVAGAAQTIALVDDDSDGCGSVTSGMAGGTTAAAGFSFAANGGITFGNGLGTIFKTNGTNRVICAVTGQAALIVGAITVVAAP